MPRFMIDTTETWHCRYGIDAENAEQAKMKFLDGDDVSDELTESISVESVNSVEEA